jgi:deoxyribonuclease-4
MRIGAHVSASGGIDKAVERAVDIGAETIQIFGSGPQSWRFKPPPDERVASFLEKTRELDIQPVFIHAIYLINLGTPDSTNLEKGIASLCNYMELAAQVKALGVIFHAGSHKGAGFDAVRYSMQEATKAQASMLCCPRLLPPCDRCWNSPPTARG